MIRAVVHAARVALLHRRIRALHRRAPDATIATLAEAAVGRLRGSARAIGDALLTAPLSGRPCVYFAIVVDYRSASHGVMRALGDDQDATAFLLEDDTGLARVEPERAWFDVAHGVVSSSKGAFDASPAQRAVLDRLALTAVDWFDVPALRYREAVIEPGAVIDVTGAGVREPDPDARPEGGYRDGSPTRLVLSSSPSCPLRITGG